MIHDVDYNVVSVVLSLFAGAVLLHAGKTGRS